MLPELLSLLLPALFYYHNTLRIVWLCAPVGDVLVQYLLISSTVYALPQPLMHSRVVAYLWLSDV